MINSLRKTFTAICILFLCSSVLADRVLDRSEILRILQLLTESPKKTWISSGTIEAIHEEHRAPRILDEEQIEQLVVQAQQDYKTKTDKPEIDSDLQEMKLKAIPFNVRYQYGNEYTMTTKVIVKYDGNRFYWDIDVVSRTDTIRPPIERTFMYEYFNLDWNRKRTFVWDGERYTTYTQTTNYASVTDVVYDMPIGIKGPLTAGIMPWGQGQLSYENLINTCDITAEEVEDDVSIRMNFSFADKKEMSLVLDPGKNYAILNCMIIRPDKPISIKTYSGYQLISGQWIPSTIQLESYDDGRLLSIDIWRLLVVNPDVPAEQDFSIDYPDDTLVEYRNTITEKPIKYLISHSKASNNNIDSSSLLDLKLAIAAGSESHNCATVAMKYISQKLDQSVTDTQLTSLIDPVNGSTSLYSLKQFAEHLGLYAKAVIADVDALKEFNDCEIILHFPGKDHYVVLGNIDDKTVRVIDLTKNRFYYGIDLTQFHLDWENGVALVLSKNPIDLPDQVNEIDGSKLTDIIGTACETGYYSCSNKIQDYFLILCTQSCDGLYCVFFERWGCICDDPVGYCTDVIMPRVKTSPCYTNEWDNCDITYEWTYYYIYACN